MIFATTSSAVNFSALSSLKSRVIASFAGRFVLNTLRLRENLGVHPAAERLLRNLLRFAARNADQPRADLPATFETQLKNLGYE